MVLKNQLLLNATPNLNNRVYPIETLRCIADQINEMPAEKRIGILPAIPYHDFDVTVKNMAFTFENARVVDDTLIADIEILDTPSGQMIMAVNAVETWSYVFRPAGQATLPSEEQMMHLMKIPIGVGTDYKFFTIQAVKSTDDSLQYPKPEWDHLLPENS
jgi:hypothetical protein